MFGVCMLSVYVVCVCVYVCGDMTVVVVNTVCLHVW